MSAKDSDIKPNIILDDEKAILLDHNYDGIEELDNPLPKWWQIIFYGTIIFSVFYVGYYEYGSGPSSQQELETDLAAVRALAPPAPQGADDIVAKIDGLKGDATAMVAGKAVYDGKCLACHGDKGQGLVGPNLTDKFWIHGDGKAAAVAKVVTEGVADKGMPPWGPVLTPDELAQVSAYVISMRGTNAPGGKEPQGAEVAE